MGDSTKEKVSGKISVFSFSSFFLNNFNLLKSPGPLLVNLHNIVKQLKGSIVKAGYFQVKSLKRRCKFYWKLPKNSTNKFVRRQSAKCVF